MTPAAPLRIGIAGGGVVADYGHAPAIAATKGMELAALYDPDPEACRRFVGRYPWLRTTTNFSEFLSFGLDAVTVASPAPAHKDNVLAMAHAGLPVLCEKPIALDDGDATAMQVAMENSGKPFGVAFCYRFSSVARSIKHLLDAGAIGEPRLIRLVYLWNLHGKWELGADGSRVESPRRRGRFIEGGPLVDCGVHQIDLARWWTGSHVTEFEAYGARVEEHETPGHLWLHMHHESGCATTVEVSFSYGSTVRDAVDIFTYELVGTAGLIRYNRDGWRLEMRNDAETRWLDGGGEKDFGAMYAAWRDVLVSGNLGDFPGARDAREASRIAGEATRKVQLQLNGKLTR